MDKDAHLSDSGLSLRVNFLSLFKDYWMINGHLRGPFTYSKKISAVEVMSGSYAGFFCIGFCSISWTFHFKRTKMGAELNF